MVRDFPKKKKRNYNGKDKLYILIERYFYKCKNIVDNGKYI